jgi:hypothetical protein
MPVVHFHWSPDPGTACPRTLKVHADWISVESIGFGKMVFLLNQMSLNGIHTRVVQPGDRMNIMTWEFSEAHAPIIAALAERWATPGDWYGPKWSPLEEIQPTASQA